MRTIKAKVLPNKQAQPQNTVKSRLFVSFEFSNDLQLEACFSCPFFWPLLKLLIRFGTTEKQETGMQGKLYGNYCLRRGLTVGSNEDCASGEKANIRRDLQGEGPSGSGKRTHEETRVLLPTRALQLAVTL